MHTPSDRRRRTSSPALPAGMSPAEEGWITFVGKGFGFHDCPLCRELASRGGGSGDVNEIEAIVGVNTASLPMLMSAGWLDDLIELVGPNATVQLMGRELEGKPIEVISMAAFLARVGYE